MSLDDIDIDDIDIDDIDIDDIDIDDIDAVAWDPAPNSELRIWFTWHCGWR